MPATPLDAMKKLLLLFLVSSAVADIAPPPCSANTDAFRACRSNLANSLNINITAGTQIFKDYTLLYNDLLYTWANPVGSTDGPLNACNALETFRGCLYSSNNVGCMNIQNLAANTDVVNAWLIDGTLSMYKFNCGPGLNTLWHEGLSCTQRIINGYQNYLQKCVSTYQTQITLTPANGCTYVNQLISCWQTPFSANNLQNCFRADSAVHWWACEANKQFTIDEYPNCGIQCDSQMGMFASSRAYLDQHHKIVDGEYWYKIFDHWDIVNGEKVYVTDLWMNN